MIRRSAVLLCALLAACAGPASTPAPRSSGLAVTHATVVDVESGQLLPDHTVLVRDGRITQVSPSAQTRVPAGYRVVDAENRFMIPGLWDAHIHITYAGRSAYPAYVANGVTSARDLGGRLPDLLTWRREVESGALVGPRVYAAGPNLEGAWWLDRVMELASTDSLLKSVPFLEISPRYRVGSLEHAQAAVDSVRRMGGEMVKFRNLRGDEFRTLAREARAKGVPLVGHAPRGVPLTEVADFGVRSVEHMETVMLALGDAAPAERSRVFAHLARGGTAITATMVTDIAYRQTPDSVARAVIADTDARLDPRRRFVSRDLIRMWNFGLDTKKFESATDWGASHRRQVEDLRRAREAGVRILVGTDLGVSLVYPGFSVHDELRILVDEGGLSPLEALRGATIYPARSMSLENSVGRIAVGHEADFVLLAADPLADIRNTQRIRAVVLDGRYLDRAALDQLLVDAAARARQ